MSAKKSFFELIKERKEILWAPCIYDCISAACAEAIGFEAVTISSMEQTMSLVGGRPLGLLSFDEMLFSAERIAKSTSMAVLADTEDGGATPMEVYKNIKRFAEAGIMAVTIEDTDCRKLGDKPMGHDMFLPAEHWAANVAAAVEAVKAVSQPVSGSKDIARVGTISSGDEVIGSLISEAMEKVSQNGVITIEESKTARDAAARGRRSRAERRDRPGRRCRAAT